jgi:hypothetical protein
VRDDVRSHRAWMRDPDANNAEAIHDGSGWVVPVEPGRPGRGLYRCR